MSSREVLLQQVIDLAMTAGWRVYHPRPARTKHGWKTALTGYAGYPDLTMVRPPRCVIAEIKSARDKPTTEQQEWLEQLATVPGLEVYVWYLEEWDAIVEVLKR